MSTQQVELTIEQELSDTLDLTQKRKEDRQDYLNRAVDAVRDLDDNGWEGLSLKVQEWFNSAANARKKEQELPDFPDIETEQSEDEEQSSEDDNAEEETDVDTETQTETNSSKKKPPAKKASPPSAAKAPAKKVAAKKVAPVKKAAAPKKERTPSMRRDLKTIVVKKPDITVEALIEKLKAKGHKPTDVTVASMRGDTRDTLRVLLEQGMLDIEL